MKEKIFKFVRVSNQVLLFLAALLFIVMISKDLISDLLRKTYEPPKVQIIEEKASTENTQVETIYLKDYYSKLQDVYIFQITAKSINRSSKHRVEKSSSIAMMYADSGSGYIKDNAINLLFVKDDGSNRILLEHDALISSFSEARFSEKEAALNLESNIYLIAKVDSNKDGYLDGDDKVDLYISAYDGSDMTLVMEDVASYQVIDDNVLLITQSQGTDKEFYRYKLNDEAPTKLNTKITLTKI